MASRAQIVQQENDRLAHRLSTLETRVDENFGEDGDLVAKLEKAKLLEKELLEMEKSMNDRAEALKNDNSALFDHLSQLESRAEQVQQAQLGHLRSMEESLLAMIVDHSMRGAVEGEENSSPTHPGLESSSNADLLQAIQLELSGLREALLPERPEGAISRSGDTLVTSENLRGGPDLDQEPSQEASGEGGLQQNHNEAEEQREEEEEGCDDCEDHSEELQELLLQNALLRRQLAMLEETARGLSLGTEGDDNEDEDDDDDGGDDAGAEGEVDIDEDKPDEDGVKEEDAFARRTAQLASLRSRLAEMSAVLDDNQTTKGEAGPTGVPEDPTAELLGALEKLDELERQARHLEEENVALEDCLKDLKAKEARLAQKEESEGPAEDVGNSEWELFCKRAEEDSSECPKVVIIIDLLSSSSRMRSSLSLDLAQLSSELKLPTLKDPEDPSAMVGLYVLGGTPALRKQAKQMHWMAYFRTEATAVDSSVVADLTELLISFGSQIRYYFIGCDTSAYLPVFEKAAKKKIRTLTTYSLPILSDSTTISGTSSSSSTPSSVHASLAGLGYTIQPMAMVGVVGGAK